MHESNFQPIDLSAPLGGIIVHDEEIRIKAYVQEDGSIAMVLPFHRALTRGDDAGVDYGPVVTLLDTISGVTALHGLGYLESTATLDLRIDFLTPASICQDILATASACQLFGQPSRGSVLVQAEAQGAQDGHIIARANGRFFRKDLPDTRKSHNLRSAHDIDKYNNFNSFMGFSHESNGTILLPYRVGLIGNGTLPSLHGGVLAAHMLEAARSVMLGGPTPEPASAHFVFQHYAKARDVVAAATVIKPGRSVSFVHTTSTQPGSDRPIASATFTFVAPQSRDRGCNGKQS